MNTLEKIEQLEKELISLKTECKQNKEKERLTRTKKVEDLVYKDVVHCKTKKEWTKLKPYQEKLSDWDDRYTYYLMGGAGVANTMYNEPEYTNYEFSNIIFPVDVVNFKEGDYVKVIEKYTNTGGSNDWWHIGDIYKLTSIDTSSFYVTDLNGRKNGWDFTKIKLEKPTTEEIKECLITIAKEKGFVKDIKYASAYDGTPDGIIRGEFTLENNNCLKDSCGRYVYYGDKNRWATIIPSDIILYFGSESFTIKKGEDFATTPHGRVSKQQIAEAIKYIENPPKLNTYPLSFFNSKGEQKSMEYMSERAIGFGCVQGKLSELKIILKAFES